MWKSGQIDFLKKSITPKTVEEIASYLGKTEEDVSLKIQELRLTKQIDPTDQHTMKLEARLSAAQQEVSNARRQLSIYKNKAGIFEALVEEMAEIVTPLTALPTTRHAIPEGAREEHVVLHLSDEHMDEIVLPHTVGQFEEYNFPIAMRRAETLVDKTLDITQNHLPNHTLDTLWILAYGDHSSGEIHGSVDRSYYKNQFRNSFAISQVHAQMIRELAPYFSDVVYVGISGNHGRKSVKKDYHGPWNNWDYMIHENARQLCSQLENVQFLIPQAWATIVNINEHNFHIEHGDDLKAWNGIPFYGIERKTRRLTALNAINAQRVRYYVMGHWHTASSLGQLDGETIVNGSWKGTDPYVYGAFSGYNTPWQWIHGVNEDGISWRHKIALCTESEKDGPQRYKISLADV